MRDATDDPGGEDDGDGTDSEDDGDGAGEELADEAGKTVMNAILSAAATRAENVRFARYPYADGVHGWVVSEAVAPLPSASFRFSMDYAYN